MALPPWRVVPASRLVSLALVLVGAAFVACASYTNPEQDAGVVFAKGCADPTAPKCGAHGKCSEANGKAVCACDTGYQGETCGECAAGLQDDDHDGTCEPACAENSCGAHSRCSLVSGKPSCKCAPGYAAPSEGAPCAWAGLVSDPSFAGTPAGAWELENVTLDTTIAKVGAVSLRDPGAALATPETAACPDKTPHVRQTIEMPTVAESEPLALTMSTFASNCPQFFGCLTIPTWQDGKKKLVPPELIPQSPNGVTRTYCLGERWYGHSLKLDHSFTGGCTGNATYYQDHTSIAPSAECPLPGAVLNPNFDKPFGWSDADTDGANAVAEVKLSGIGHLAGKRYCKSPSLNGTVSIPEVTGKKVAVSFTYSGTANEALNVYLGFFPIGSAIGTNTPVRASFCIPDVGKGLAWPLRVGLASVQPPPPFNCGNVPQGDRDFEIDDFSVGADPSCADSLPVPDPTFDTRPAGTPAWVMEGDTVGTARIQSGGRSGNALVLATSRLCHSTSAHTMMSIPEFPATEGYAIRFWQKGAIASPTQLTTTFGAVSISSGWEQRSQCLPHQYAGYPYQLNFEMSFPAVTGFNCDQPVAENVFIDDIEIVQDAACVGK